MEKRTKCDGTWLSDPAHFRRPSRRDVLYVGMLGGIGLTLGDYFKAQAAEVGSGQAPAAKSVIHIYMPGGIAAQESWDPKPDAPLEYRGPLGSVKSKIDGERLSEFMSHTAAIADNLCIVRSMSHGEAAHERGQHNMFTGYRPSPAIQFPSFGSVVSHELGVRNNLPPYICVPSMPVPYAGSGYLSNAYGPFSLGSDPAQDKGFHVRDLSLPGDVSADRFANRRSMLTAVDDHFKKLEKSDALDAMDSFYQRAYAMISSKQAREAFDLQAESEETKQQYGKNQAGLRMLMARRLVEAGVRFVTMSYGGWDHHVRIKEGISSQMPTFDKAFAALISDLKQRGLLDSTLVMVSSEFGRSPKINKDQGRDHYPKVFSICLAGGGIKKGIIHGASDAICAEPASDPLSIEDMAMTLYHQLGVNGEKKLMSPGNRPIDIVRGGKVVESLLA